MESQTKNFICVHFTVTSRFLIFNCFDHKQTLKVVIFKIMLSVFSKHGGMSYPFLIGINSIYVSLLRYVHNVSFIVTTPLSYTEVVMYQ